MERISQKHKIEKVEIAKALGFNIIEKMVDSEDESYVEYEIDFAGKSAEEIAVISDYLKYIEYLSKWNGELPDVVTGDSANIMIPVDNPLN